MPLINSFINIVWLLIIRPNFSLGDKDIISGVKYLSKTTFKYYLSSFVWYLYFTIFYFWLLLFHYIPKENNVHFTPYIFPDTYKSSLHFECLAGQENGPIQIQFY